MSGRRCGSPGCGKQRVLSPHQLPHLHSDVAELVAQQAAEAHEGRGVAHDLLSLWHHLVPLGRGPGGLTTPGDHRGDGVEGATQGTRGPKITGQAQKQLPYAHSLSLRVSGTWGCPEVARGTSQGQMRNLRELEKKRRFLTLKRRVGFWSRDQKRTLTADPAVWVRHTTLSTQHCPRPSMVETTSAA